MYVSHRLRACRGHFDFVSIKARRPISRNPVWQVPTVPPKVLSSIIGLARMQRRWSWRREHFDVGAAGSVLSNNNNNNNEATFQISGPPYLETLLDKCPR